MKYFDNVTLKVKKTHVFLAAFIIICLITVSMIMNAYREYAEAAPKPLDDMENIQLIQLDKPSADAKKAVISTTAGDITIVLYESEAPNAVSMFKGAAASGQYNGLNAKLYEQHSIFTLNALELDSEYESELHKNLWPFKGAVCMTPEGDIIFVNTIEFTDEDKEYLTAEGELSQVRAAFLEHGGVPNYSRLYTVFGQVISGMDVLEKIACSSADEIITVNSITVSE